MTNPEIAKQFQLLGQLMELHGENPFKIRSYQSAYRTLKNMEAPVAHMDMEQLSGIKGIGKAISAKIRELVDDGAMKTLERYKGQTPEGIIEMLGIKGFGPKKINVVWKELGVESVGELMYAVNENRLLDLKGFGQKTQNDLKEKLTFFQKSKDKYHYAALEPIAHLLIKQLRSLQPSARVEFTGSLRRAMPVLERIELIVAGIAKEAISQSDLDFAINQVKDQQLIGTFEGFPCTLNLVSANQFGTQQFILTGNDVFVQSFAIDESIDLPTEEAIFDKQQTSWITPELREYASPDLKAWMPNQDTLIQHKDIKGVLHVHTTYSDGMHTLKEMIQQAQELGYAYIGITDHSKSAFYANGLQPERLIEQMKEIDLLQEEFAEIKIFKGIESDILSDGSLDYDDDLLAQLDFVIASVHSNLRMDEAKATQRLIKAISHPATKILGHPTGRLLLSRPGYPINFEEVFEACAQHHVAIELNANPYRLDIDWTYIPEILAKGVQIAINPDAHRKAGITDIRYGVLAARKGGLTAARCLNTYSADEFSQFCSEVV